MPRCLRALPPATMRPPSRDTAQGGRCPPPPPRPEREGTAHSGARGGLPRPPSGECLLLPVMPSPRQKPEPAERSGEESVISREAALDAVPAGRFRGGGNV